MQHDPLPPTSSQHDGEPFSGDLLSILPLQIGPDPSKDDPQSSSGWGERWHALFIVRTLGGQPAEGPARVMPAAGRSSLVTILHITPSWPLPPKLLPAHLAPGPDLVYLFTEGLEPGMRPDGLRILQVPSVGDRERLGADELRAVAASRAEVRCAAIQVLAALGDRAPLAPLVQALRDGNDAVRSVAADALAGLGSRAPVAPFLEEDLWRDHRLRSSAVKVFNAHPDDVPPDVLVHLLQDAEGWVRSAAAEALGRLGGRAPIGPLVATLRSDDAFGVRWSAARALGAVAAQTGALPPEVFHALVQALEDPESLVWQEAARVLAAWARRDALPPAVADRVAARLAEHRALLSQMDENARAAARQRARAVDPDTPAGRLDRVAAAAHADSATRIAALQRLATLGPDAPLDPLLEALDDEDGAVQVAAAEALGALGGRGALDAEARGRVAEALFAQVAATRALRLVAARDALTGLAHDLPQAALVAHLGDQDVLPRVAALEALIALGADAPRGPIVAAVGDRWDPVRALALDALARTWPEELARVGEEAERLLAESKPGPVLGSLVGYHLAADIVRRGDSSPVALSALADLLAWPYWQTRTSALEALRFVGVPLPAEVVARVGTLTRDPESAAVREAARSLLGEGPPS